VNPLVLGTFGAVLSFALELEAAVTAFYKSAISSGANPKLKQLANEYTQRGDKRVQLLLRLRRENTTEMLLEPITGLDGNQFRPQTKIAKGTSEPGLTKLAVAMEERAQAFYAAAVEKTNFLSEAAAAFERLADEHGENARRLA
jgi:hypothetical protein